MLRDAVTGLLTPANRQTCLLIADPDLGALAGALDRLLASTGWETVRVGRELSADLLRFPPRDRPRRVRPWLTERLTALVPGPVVCRDVDLLCEPSLALDPVLLLRRASRVVPLIVAWPGTYDGVVLTYAAPDHDHFRRWVQPEVAVVTLDQVEQSVPA